MTNIKNIINSLVLAGVLICAPAFVYDAQAEDDPVKKAQDAVTKAENAVKKAQDDYRNAVKKTTEDNDINIQEKKSEACKDNESREACQARKTVELTRLEKAKEVAIAKTKAIEQQKVDAAKEELERAKTELTKADETQAAEQYTANVEKIKECKSAPDSAGCQEIKKIEQQVQIYENSNPKSELVKAQEKARKEEAKQAKKDEKKNENEYKDNLKLIEKCKNNPKANGCNDTSALNKAKTEVENYEQNNPQSDVVIKQKESAYNDNLKLIEKCKNNSNANGCDDSALEAAKDAVANYAEENPNSDAVNKQKEKERKEYENAKKDLVKAKEKIEKFCSDDESKRDARKCEAAQKEMADALAITNPYEDRQLAENIEQNLAATIAEIDAELADEEELEFDDNFDFSDENETQSMATSAKSIMDTTKKAEADAKKKYDDAAAALQQAQFKCSQGDEDACAYLYILKEDLAEAKKEYEEAYKNARDAEQNCREMGCEQEISVNINPHEGQDYLGFRVDNSDKMYTGSNDVFKTVTRRAAFILYHLKPLIYMLAGFGLIGFAFAAIFNKISWKWFGNLAIGLFLVANTGRLVEYMVFPSGGSKGYMELQNVGALNAFGDKITVSQALGDTQYAWVDNTYYVPNYTATPTALQANDQEVVPNEESEAEVSDKKKETRGFCKAETKGGGLFGGGAFSSCVKDIIAAGKKVVNTVQRAQATVDAVRGTVNSVVTAAQNIGDAAKIVGDSIKAGDVAGAFQGVAAIGGNVRNAIGATGSMLNFANESMSSISNNIQDMTKSRDQVAELNLLRASGESTNVVDKALKDSGYAEGVRNVTVGAENVANTFIDGANTGANLAGAIQNFNVPNKVIDGKLYGKSTTINDLIDENRKSDGGSTSSGNGTATPSASYQYAQKQTSSAQNSYYAADSALSNARTEEQNKRDEADRLQEIAKKTGSAVDIAAAKLAEYEYEIAKDKRTEAETAYKVASGELNKAKEAEATAQVDLAKHNLDEADRKVEELEELFETSSGEDKKAIEAQLEEAEGTQLRALLEYLTLTESKPVGVDPVQAAKQAAYNLSQAKSTAKTAEDKASSLEKDAKDKDKEAAELRKKANESGDPIDEINADRATTEAARAKEDAKDARAKADEAATKEQEAQTAADEAYAKGATYAKETAERDKADAEAKIEEYEKEIETLQGNLSTLEENYKNLAAEAEKSKADADVVAAGTAYTAYQDMKTKIGELQTQIGKEKERKRKAEDAYYDAAEAEITYSK